MDERLGVLEPGLVAALLLALTCLALLAALAVLGRTRNQRHTSKQQQIVESIIQVTSTIYNSTYITCNNICDISVWRQRTREARD